MKTLFCIKHGVMVKIETRLFGHLETIPIDDYPFLEMDYCEFPDGWAVMPPPEFDIDEWMQTAEEPDEEVSQIFE